MTDKELLELAAKASGVVVARSRLDDPICNDMLVAESVRNPYQKVGSWNPLIDDGDALRLAVKLNISLEIYPEHVYAVHNETSAAQYRDTGSGGSMEQVVREAIVACAAEIGKATTGEPKP